MRRTILAAAVVMSAPAAALAQRPMHSAHGGEHFGTVHFATSCAPATAVVFERAVALLHSFEFGGAIRGFNDVLAADSSCAMAYWGIALSRWSNPMAAGNRGAAQLRSGAEAISAARRLESRATARERGYIEAAALLYDDSDRLDQATRVAAYSRAMEALSAREPADTEARIFYAISLTAAAPPGDRTYANQLKAGEILEALWRREPDHPGLAHYIIHSYDYPALAAKARAAARRYSGIAPSAAHAQHMPSHIFTRVGDWEASIAANRRSIDVAGRSGAVSEQLHASDYLMYAYLQLGRDSSARVVLDSLPALAARFDPNAITGAAPPSAAFFAMAAIPARYALERRAWKEAAALEVRPNPFPWTTAMTYFARALGASHTGDLAGARASVDSLDAISGRLRASNEPYWAEQVGIQAAGARAWLAFGQRDTAQALALMREAARREDLTDKNAVTPGPLAPVRELLADMLVELGRTREAHAEYAAVLKREPGRRHAAEGIALTRASR